MQHRCFRQTNVGNMIYGTHSNWSHVGSWYCIRSTPDVKSFPLLEAKWWWSEFFTPNIVFHCHQVCEVEVCAQTDLISALNSPFFLLTVKPARDCSFRNPTMYRHRVLGVLKEDQQWFACPQRVLMFWLCGFLFCLVLTSFIVNMFSTILNILSQTCSDLILFDLILRATGFGFFANSAFALSLFLCEKTTHIQTPVIVMGTQNFSNQLFSLDFTNPVHVTIFSQ